MIGRQTRSTRTNTRFPYTTPVRAQWQTSPLPVIVDASALDWIEPGSTPLNSRRVLTPHPGEAARLLGVKASAIQENRVAALREISAKFGNRSEEHTSELQSLLRISYAAFCLKNKNVHLLLPP